MPDEPTAPPRLRVSFHPGQAGTAILDLLLPAVCPLCRAAQGPDLCPACRAILPHNAQPACSLCTGPLDGGACPACGGEGLSHLDGAVAAYVYRGAMRRLVGDAKAGARPAAVAALAALLPLPEGIFDAVVAVPPSPGRRPGPHLATACARQAARRLGVPLLPALSCLRHAREQHRLSRRERADNVVELFRCQGRVPERVLLVDDILTSGATATAAAASLRQHGAKRVCAAFLCRTPGKAG